MLTVSDGVVAGTREDRGGPAVVARLADRGVRRWWPTGSLPTGSSRWPRRSSGSATGSPGWSSRRVAPASVPVTSRPEGTRAVIEREAPGLAEAMRLVNPLGRLSRGVAGTRGQALDPEHAGFHRRGASSASTPCSTWCPTRWPCWRVTSPTERRSMCQTIVDRFDRPDGTVVARQRRSFLIRPSVPRPTCPYPRGATVTPADAQRRT